MITSGLVVQNRGYGSFQSSRTRERISAHPYVYGFDSVPVRVSEFHNTNLVIPPSVNYMKIFGRGITPSEKDYFMTHGNTMIQSAAEGVKPGRARRGVRKGKQAGSLNDSFKNLVNFEDWKKFMYGDKSSEMMGVDAFGQEDYDRAVNIQKLKDEIYRSDLAAKIASVYPVLSNAEISNVTSQTVSNENSRRGSIASLTEVEGMQQDQEPVPQNADESALSDLFANRLGDINGENMNTDLPHEMQVPVVAEEPIQDSEMQVPVVTEEPIQDSEMSAAPVPEIRVEKRKLEDDDGEEPPTRKYKADPGEVKLSSIIDARKKLRNTPYVQSLSFHDQMIRAIKANGSTNLKKRNKRKFSQDIEDGSRIKRMRQDD